MNIKEKIIRFTGILYTLVTAAVLGFVISLITDKPTDEHATIRLLLLLSTCVIIVTFAVLTSRYVGKLVDQSENEATLRGVRKAMGILNENMPNSVLNMDVLIFNNKGEQVGTESVYTVISDVLTKHVKT